MTQSLTQAAQQAPDLSTPTLCEMVKRHALSIDSRATLEDMPQALAFQIDMARALLREFASLQPSQADHGPAGEACAMPGASGFTMVSFPADQVPVGTKIYTHPASRQIDSSEPVPGVVDAKWRDAALRFDRHRMQALWHLQAMLQDPGKHADVARQFLADPSHFGVQVPRELVTSAITHAATAAYEACAKVCDEVKAKSRQHLFRSGASVCAGEIRALSLSVQDQAAVAEIGNGNDGNGPSTQTSEVSNG